MNNQATLDRLRELKLTGMFQAFEALLQLPVHQQPPADELLAQLTDAEHEYRQQRKTQMAIRAARFRYTASLEELHYTDGRNLDKTAILRLADCRFIDRSENIFLTGATGCGKTGRPEPLYSLGPGVSSLSVRVPGGLSQSDQTVAASAIG
jgi:DNA replication protein DnaC